MKQVAALLFFLGALLLLIWGETGLYLIAGGTFFAYMAAFSDSWVLLIEKNR